MDGKVSIIIPTYKRPTTLKRAINSCLNQSYNNIEVIVVDDNNEDSEYREITEKLMKEYEDNNKVIYLKHKKNMNGATARNTGIRHAKGDYITFLDDDDVLLKDKIRLQVKKLKSMNNEYGVVYCGYEKIKDNKIIMKENANKSGNLASELLKMSWDFGSGSNPLFRRRVFHNVGLFDVRFKRHQDWEFIIRVLRKYKICNVPEILLKVYKDSTINFPEPQAYVIANEKYLNKFKNYIHTFDKTTINEIYKSHSFLIAKYFLLKKQYKTFYKYYKKAKSFSNISLKQHIMIIYYFVGSIFPKVENLRDYISYVKLRRKEHLSVREVR